jgi:5'-nucleotidase
VVAGINYGENVGSGVTISGTVGAALEAASFGVPALAVSLETDKIYHRSHSDEVDFSAAAHFARFFAGRLLSLPPMPDVDMWKVEVPSDATPATPWQVTRLSRQRYYHPLKPARLSLSDQAIIDYSRRVDPIDVEPDSDVGALIARVVSLTPLSLDMTSRVDFGELARAIEQGTGGMEGTEGTSAADFA